MALTALSIKRWAAWMPGVYSQADWRDWALQALDYNKEDSAEAALPNVKAIPAMLRRRLSPLGKMALSVAWPLVDKSLPSVFCSRHGELERTVGMLTNLANNEPLSPTHFSLSVHNAIGGVYSIARKDPSSITALAIGDEGFSQSLVEASMILEEGNHSEVLCVIYDAPIPEIYADASPARVSPRQPYAVAFVIGGCSESEVADESRIERGSKKETDCEAKEAAEGQAGNFIVSLTAKNEKPEREVAKEMPDALQFLRFLLSEGQKNLELPSKRHSWYWKKGIGQSY